MNLTTPVQVHARNRVYLAKTSILIFVSLSLLLSWVHRCHGQDELIGPAQDLRLLRIRWEVYDPRLIVPSRVHAQAELIRAQGDAAIGFAVARDIRADAYSKELDNWMKELQIYWDRKIEAQRKQIELGQIEKITSMQYLNDQKWRNNQTWNRIKNHSELSRAGVDNGDALNFLLARLAVTALPYQFDETSSRFDRAALHQMELDDELLGNIMLRFGSFKSFAANTSFGEIGPWPFFLRWEEFSSEREAFENARQIVADQSESTGRAMVESIQHMQLTLTALEEAFAQSKAVKEWVAVHRRYAQYSASDRFLRELEREIKGLETAGTLRPLPTGYDPSRDGRNLVSLLCFMNRNGLKFAPSKPGSEFAYHELFVLMRSLYLTVADEDSSIESQDLSRLVE